MIVKYRADNLNTVNVNSKKLPVVFLLDEVVPRTESNKVSIVSRGRNGYGTCASNVSMTELVGEALELVGVEVVIIP